MPTGTPVGKAMYVQPVPLGDPLADASNAPPFQMLTVCGPVSAATLYHQMPLSNPDATGGQHCRLWHPVTWRLCDQLASIDHLTVTVPVPVYATVLPLTT